MYAICKSCNKLVSWRNQRGNSMPKVCACGGELVLAAWTPEGWKIAERKPQPKRHRAECVLCGRAGMLPGRLRTLTKPETFCVQERSPGLIGHLLGGTIENQLLEAGAVVCRWHESIEERQTKGYDGDPYPVALRKQPA